MAMKTFTARPISKETKAKVVQTAKNGAVAVGTVLGAIGSAFVTVMAHEANCRRGIHEVNSWGTCKHCYKRPLSPLQVLMVGGMPGTVVMAQGQTCNHTWGKADRNTVSCLNCGKRLYKFSWDHDEAAWAKAILAQLGE
jgi:hypothetical protein